MKKFSLSLLANIINVTVSTLTGLLIPRLVGVTQFGYWQLYVFYITYILYFHFGWVDGIYLRNGGKDYSELDTRLLHSQFWLYCLFELFVSLSILGASFALGKGDKRTVVMLAGVNCLVLLPRVYFQFLLQASGRVRTYANNLVTERMICAFLTIVLLLFGHRTVKTLIFADLLAKGVALVMILISCHDIVFSKGIGFKDNIKEAKENFHVGYKLTFATVSSMLLIGIIQLAVERNWNIEMFGMVSFAMVTTQSIVQFLNQISVVLFPLLKRSESNDYPVVFAQTGRLITFLSTSLLLLFYPLELGLTALLPDYVMGISFLGLLIPVCLFEGRTTLMLGTFLKTLRKEKDMLIIDVIMILLSLGVTIVTVYIMKNLTAAVMSSVLLLALRCLLSDIVVQRNLGIRNYKELCLISMTTILFWVCCCSIKGLKGWLLYVLYYVILGAFRFKNYKVMFHLVHGERA